MTPAPPPSTIDVTVVLPVRNEGGHIDLVLGDLLAQTFPAERTELLVVDGRSDDDTRARVATAAARDRRVRLLDNPRRLSSSARAIGVREARGRYVAFVDGHCRVPRTTLLADMVELFERTGAACLGRPQPLVASATGAVARAVSVARSSPFGHSTKSEIYGDREGPASPVSHGAMYRREVFEQVGSFDEGFDACEDVELNWRVERAGLPCVTSGRLAVAYEPRRTLRGLFRQMHRYGLGRARLHRKHPAAFTVESLVPAAFVLGVPALPLAPLLPRPLGLAVAAAWALYLVLALGFAAAAAARAGRLALLPLVVLAFVTIHLGLGSGYLRGWLTPKPSPVAEAAS